MISPFPMLVCLASWCLLCVGSPTLSSSPFVHGFPRPVGVTGRPSLPWGENRRGGRRWSLDCVRRFQLRARVGPPWLRFLFLPVAGGSVVRVLSSTLLPGFIGPESSATIRGSATPCPLPAGGIAASQIGFLRRLEQATRRRNRGLPGVRHTTSPYAVQLQCASVLPIGYRDSLIHVCSPPSAHPSSWFAVRYVHGICHQASFRRPIAGPALAACWRSPSVRSRRVSGTCRPPCFGPCAMPGTHQPLPAKAGSVVRG
jgi:hypothetical protein